jgi:hypothetical protein
LRVARTVTVRISPDAQVVLQLTALVLHSQRSTGSGTSLLLKAGRALMMAPCIAARSVVPLMATWTPARSRRMETW